ncbi:MAG: hypothetical protein V1885_02695 [Candidatus Brennerbacteria bacterium]
MQFPIAPIAKYLKYILGFAELLLGFRALLLFLEANAIAPIVELLYTVTDAIMVPFSGIFSDFILRNGSVIDLNAFSAMVGYPIILYAFIELLRIISKDDEPGAAQK